MTQTKHNTKTRLLSMLLTLAMVLGMMPTVALAADARHITITDGNGYAGTLPTGMAWDVGTSTLTLNGYNGGSIGFGNAPTGDHKVIINLSGTNTITVTETTVGLNFMNINDVTFTGDGSLTINMTGDGQWRCGISFNRTDGPNEPKLKFSGSGTVTINMTQNGTTAALFGIDIGVVYASVLSGGILTVGDDATLNINMKGKSNYDHVALYVDGYSVINGTLNITGTDSSGLADDGGWKAYANPRQNENNSIGANARVKVDYPNRTSCQIFTTFKLAANGNAAIASGWITGEGTSTYTTEDFFVKRSDKSPTSTQAFRQDRLYRFY